MIDSTDLLLVVDDDDTSLEEARILAERLGCEWVAARSSDQVRDVLALRSPTIALVAIDMKGDDGIAALLMLASVKAPPACVLIGGMDARILSSAGRLGRQHGLTVLGTMGRPFDQREAEQLFALALRGVQRIPAEDLRQAVEEQQFLLHFQPQAVFAGDGLRIRGMEAFVRWQHPRRGLLYPAQFLDAMEQAGLTAPLTDLVITEAVRQAGGWNHRGHELSVTINLSPGLVRDRQFPMRLAVLLREFELPPERLIVDVTEESSRTEFGRILDVFTRLRILGVGLSLDNFGTGYSSLTELYKMPFTEVKVDRSLIGELPNNREACVVSEAVAILGHKLGLKVCAAGVETEAAMQMLRDYGYDTVQGRAICEPVPAAQIEARIRSGRWSTLGTTVPAVADGARALSAAVEYLHAIRAGD